MSAIRQGIRSALGNTRCTQQERPAINAATRTFSASAPTSDSLEQQPSNASSSSNLEPHLVHTPRLERRLLKSRSVTPVGSRRRRAALQSSSQIPFEQLPYQCFQEARKVLATDRQEKIQQIETQRARLERLRSTDVAAQGEWQKEQRMKSMAKHLEELKIWADINDPTVKKRFEDGEGDMNKPIYRFLADRQWRSYKRRLLMQRITQMTVVPDVLPGVDPVMSVDLAFGSRGVQPGEFVDSRVSEVPARLKIQPFDKGERYVTVVVVNPDVPNVEKDGFDYRCHFLACNIVVSPTSTSVPLHLLSKQSQVVLPWLPAYAQKGAPYNRMSIFVLHQKDGKIDDIEALRKRSVRDGFILKSFSDRHSLKAVGVNLFRTQWDEGTAGVMQRAGVPGHDVEFKRKRIEPLPYKKLPGSRYR